MGQAKRNPIQPTLEELLGLVTWRLRALRREERVEALVLQGWSHAAAVEFVRTRDGPVATWLEDQDPRRTKRVAQNKPLANRASGRKRSRPRRWWRRFDLGT